MSSPTRFAIIVSRFPKFTETFILQELRGLEDRDVDFELYALNHESVEQLQPDAVDLDARANYISLRSAEPVAAQWYWLRRSPGRWAAAWFRAMVLSKGSTETLLRAPVAIALAMTMARRMQAQGVQRVHAHWATYPTLAAFVIKQLTGIPYSFTAHAHDIFVEFGGLAAKVAEADLVITCTDFGRGRILEQAGPAAAAKVHVIHHGTRLDRFTVQPLPPHQPDDRHIHLLCVASLEEYKGHRHLFAAVRRLVDEQFDVTVELLGDGDLRAELEALARQLGLSDRISFRGRQPSDEVRAAVTRADAFVLASVQLDSGFMDGIPNVLVEALAMGRPVVASSLPGIRELIIDGETGLLATSGDPASLAAAIRRLVDEPGLAETLVTQGRRKVEQEHDASTCLDQVAGRFRSLTGS